VNSLIEKRYPLFQLYLALRGQLMEILTDDDLSFRLENNPTLGALCREIGEVEYAYIQSFKSYKLDFSYRNDEPGLEGSVRQLSAWYEMLDRELRAAIEAFSDDDLEKLRIDRGDGFAPPVPLQLEIYKEALLIFCGKVSVYLKVMGKPLPKQWQHWIG